MCLVAELMQILQCVHPYGTVRCALIAWQTSGTWCQLTIRTWHCRQSALRSPRRILIFSVDLYAFGQGSIVHNVGRPRWHVLVPPVAVVTFDSSSWVDGMVAGIQGQQKTC